MRVLQKIILQNDVVYIYATQTDDNTMYEIETNFNWDSRKK